jgi:hypothetical protein
MDGFSVERVRSSLRSLACTAESVECPRSRDATRRVFDNNGVETEGLVVSCLVTKKVGISAHGNKPSTQAVLN